MKKVLLSILSLGMLGTASAQVKDTVITGSGYLNQKFYSLANDEQATMTATSWHVAFAPNVMQANTAIRFNALVGTVKVLPNADINAAITAVDTTGWAAEETLYDNDADILLGAFNQSGGTSQMDFSWGEYDVTTHNLKAARTFGAKIGTAFYAIRFSLQSLAKIYTVTYFKLGETDSVTYNVNLNAYLTKNYVYSNLADQSVLDLEPATANWDLFFGQYYGDYQGIMMYKVAGVLNNLGTEVAKVIDNNPATYSYTGTEQFSANNNVIHYDWKSSGPSGSSVADTVVYFVKAKNGEIWRLVFTGFVSGTGSGADAGSYIFDKELISALGVNNVTSVFTEIYPNPANDMAQVVVDAAANTTIEIFSLAGAKVYSTEVTGGLQTLQVNTSDLNAGVYQVVVSSNGLRTAKKLMIQH